MTHHAESAELTVLTVPGHGAEDVLISAEGWVLTATDDGSLFKVRPDGHRIERLANTGGRPLGLEMLPDERVLVCDARRGLLAVDVGSGEIETLTKLVQGQKMEFCNNAAVHSSGDIYFSDSSRIHNIDRWKAEMVEDTRSGRLLKRSADGSVEILITGLRFANGVALAADESYVAVAETGGRSVVRRWLTGPRAGQDDHLVDDLPGYPDNISTGSDGLIWVSIASPRDPLLERLMHAPIPVRRAASRLPDVLQPKPKRTARVMAFDDDGTVVHDRTLDASRFHMVTGVREHNGRVWLGSLVEPAIAVFDV